MSTRDENVRPRYGSTQRDCPRWKHTALCSTPTVKRDGLRNHKLPVTVLQNKPYTKQALLDLRGGFGHPSSTTESAPWDILANSASMLIFTPELQPPIRPNCQFH